MPFVTKLLFPCEYINHLHLIYFICKFFFCYFFQKRDQEILREKQNQFMYSHGGSIRPISNLGWNNIFFSNGLQGFFNMQQLIAASSAAQQGNPNTLPNSAQFMLPFNNNPTAWSIPPPQGIQPQLQQQQLQQQQPQRNSNFQEELQELQHQQEAEEENPPSSLLEPTQSEIVVEQQQSESVPKNKQQSPKLIGVTGSATTTTATTDIDLFLQPNQWNKNTRPAEDINVEEEASQYQWPYQEYERASHNLESNGHGIIQHDIINASIHANQPDGEHPSEICTSPTAEMYYQFWPLKPDQINQKEQLPRLSPDELQTILARGGENAPILSPVHDNRVQYSDPPFLLNDFQQQQQQHLNSQESELDEHPLANVESGFPSLMVDHQQALHTERIGELMKEQQEWGKIDFLKQQKIQQGYDIETETADETENESVYEQPLLAENEPDSCYFMHNGDDFTGDEAAERDDEENMDFINNNNKSSLTPLERNYLTILQSQKDER